MKTLIRSCAAGLVVLALGVAGVAEGPELNIPDGPAQSGLEESQRKQIDEYVNYWLKALAEAKASDRIKEARIMLVQGYEKKGATALAYQGAYAEFLAVHGKGLLTGPQDPNDPLAQQKQVDFSLSVLRIPQASLQPLAQAMAAHSSPAVRFLGWMVYGTLRDRAIAEGAQSLKRLLATLRQHAGQETDPYVLRELMSTFRLPLVPDPELKIGEAEYRAAQEGMFGVLQGVWTRLCRQVYQSDSAASPEAAYDAAVGLRQLVAGLGGGVDKQAALQMVLNMTYSASRSYDRAWQLLKAAEAAKEAAGTGGAEAPVRQGAAEHAVSANQYLLTVCEEMLNELTGKEAPGDQQIRTALTSVAAATDRGAPVRLGALKWVTLLVKAHGLKDPKDLVEPATQPATRPATQPATQPATAPAKVG